MAKLQQNGLAITLPTDGTSAGLMMLDRGYTSHEHLSEVGLIQMNGRLYDPILRSFLMPDNFIQQPENTQNYNRYAYVLNNPLMYTDPSGELFGLDDLVVAVIIGAVIAATTYTMTAALADVPFTVGGLAKATFIGAASAAVTFGIGTAAGNLFGAATTFSKAGFQALAHGTFQGTMSGIQGGNFWSGFAAGALASIASSVLNAASIGTNTDGTSCVTDFGRTAQIPAVEIAFGTVMGGAGAKLTGGNFWQGAVTGMTVSWLNGVFHNKNKIYDKQLKKIYDAYPKGDPNDPNYVSRDELFKQIGGDLNEWYESNPDNPNLQNTCALRLSKALNDSGFTIPKSGATYNGGNEKNYFLTAESMTNYLSKSSVFGTPLTLNSNQKMRNGIISQTGFGGGITGHIDIVYRGQAGSHMYSTTTKYWH